MRHVLVIACLLTSISCIAQQSSRIKLVGIETGIDGFGGSMQEYPYIRANSAYGSEPDQGIETRSNRVYAGVKGEIRTANNKFGFAGGLRFSRISTALETYEWSDTDFYFFEISHANNTLEYLKVRCIEEKSDYLGIPLSVSWFPHRERFFTFYYKVGFEFNYRLKTVTEVTFVNPEMNMYQDAVTDRLKTPADFVSVFSSYVGLKIGRSKKIIVSLEGGPVVSLSENASALTNTIAGGGAQLNIQLAL